MKKNIFYSLFRKLYDILAKPAPAAGFAEAVSMADHEVYAVPESVKAFATNEWNKRGSAVKLTLSNDYDTNLQSAKWIALQLQKPLYKIDLGKVAGKYIGETEKNLAAIFDTAEKKDWILLLDEADALFGKRSDIKDAHDRYANIAVAYLEKRIGQFKGTVLINCLTPECNEWKPAGLVHLKD